MKYKHNSSQSNFDNTPLALLTLIEEAKLAAQNLLSNFSQSPDFASNLQFTFGNRIEVNHFKQAWQRKEIAFPKVEVVFTKTINGANGAFAKDTNTIYLSQEFLTANADDPNAITNVVLEEYGHYIDSQINDADAPGDEGAIFAALVQGKELSENELQQLRDEDDSVVVVLDGREVAVEQNKVGTTTRISLGLDGSEANSNRYESRSKSSISADGRYVAFESNASNLVLEDTNEMSDIFVYDRQSGTTEIVSITSNGIQPERYNINSSISNPSISADGRYITFISDLKFVSEDTISGSWDIYVYDRQTKLIEIAGLSQDETQTGWASIKRNPSISADGRYIAFESYGKLISKDNNSNDDIYVYDRIEKTVELISVASDGTPTASRILSGDSTNPSISADGRYVAFQSSAKDLVPEDTNNKTDVFIHDRETGIIRRVSITSEGEQLPSTLGIGNDSGKPSISADGRYIAFESEGRLVSEDTDNSIDIYVRDLETNETKIVSIATEAISGWSYGSGDSTSPSISADGKYVAFVSKARLVEADKGYNRDIYVHDLQTGITTRENLTFDGSELSRNLFGSSTYPSDINNPSISGNGRYISFGSNADNIVADDTNNATDIFVRDRGESFSIADDESNTTLFFEDFETDLSKWTGKQGESSSGIIVDDPLEGDRALSFTEFGNGGDIFSLEAFEHPNAKYRLSFDYLAIPVEGSIEDDMGGFAGYTYDLNDTGNSQWLVGTTTNSLNLRPNFQEIDALEQWKSIAVEYTEADSFHLTFEDFVASQGIAGDIYFDNIHLEAVSISDTYVFPEDVTALISTLDGKVGTVDSSGKFSQIANGVDLYDIALSNDSRLYGVTSGSSSGLYEIDLDSGVFSLIGSSGATLNALAFDDNDILFGAGGSSFYRIDTNTGAASHLANLGSDFNSSGDIVFDSTTNRFFATSLDGSNNALYSISKSGEATKIGNIGFDDVWGLSIEDGNLIGFTADKERILINKQTGTGTFDANISGINGQISGAAFISSSNANNNNNDTDDDNNNEDGGNSQGNLTPQPYLYENLVRYIAYEDWSEGQKTKDKIFKDSLGIDFRIDGYEVNKVFDDFDSGFYAVGLTSKDFPSVLAIRGTQKETIQDILTDLNPDGIGQNQFKSDAANEAKEWLKQQNNPDIVGHSLGGALAQMFAADLTYSGTTINNLFTFNSPGISQEYANLYNPDSIEDVHHYIVSGDPVSLGGDEYLDDNNKEDDDVTVFSYSNILSSITFEKHLRKIVDVDDIEVSTKTISVEELSSDSFNYFPNPDYLALQFLLSGLQPINTGDNQSEIDLSTALTTRGSVEAARKDLGSYIYEQFKDLENGERIELPNLEFNIGDSQLDIDNYALFTTVEASDSLISFKATDMSLEYIEDYLQIGGKATAQFNILIGKPIKAAVDFSDSDSNSINGTDRFIRLNDRSLHIVGEAKLENLLFGDFGLKQAKLFLDLEKNVIDGNSLWQYNQWKADASIQLPGGISIQGGIGFIYNPELNSQEFNYISVGGGSDIPIIDFSVAKIPLGLFLKEINGAVDNISQADPDDLTLEANGTLTLDVAYFGKKPQAALFGAVPLELSSLIELNGHIAMSSDTIKVDSDVEAGIGIEGGIELFAGVLSGTYDGIIDRNKKNFLLDVDVELYNGFVNINGDLAVNHNDGLTISGKLDREKSFGAVKIPDYIDDLGHGINTFGFIRFGSELFKENIGAAIYFNLNRDSNGDFIAWDDYVAGWGKLSWFPQTIGFKYKFDGDLECLGFEEVESIKEQIEKEIEQVKDSIYGESSNNTVLYSTNDSEFSGRTFQRLLDNALIDSQLVLTQFASIENTNSLLTTAFGQNWDEDVVNNVIRNWQNKDFSNLPKISLINSASINNANAAFADSTNTIYISREYLAYQQNNPEAVSEVILEEIGHWIDSQINSSDAAGDEGDIFSKLVRNETLSNKQLQQLQAEDDTVIIDMDGNATELNLSTSVEDSFFVGEETPWFSMAANWENDNNNVAIEVVSPDGTIYTEADIANSDHINIVEEMSDETHRIVHIDSPDAGEWTIKVTNPNDLGNVELGAIGGTNPGSIEITSLEHNTDDSTVTVNYEAFDVDSDATVSFFYDEDGEGFDGYLISDTATETDGTGSFTWNTEGVATGNYHIYAMISDDNSIPAYDYSEQSISITEEADLSVEQIANLDSVGAGEDVTYKITVTNNGDITSKGVTVTEILPESAAFKSATINVSEQAEDYIRFDLGNLAAGASTEFEITATMSDTLGQASSRASIDAKTFDPDVTNDISVADVIVEEDNSVDTPAIEIDLTDTVQGNEDNEMAFTISLSEASTDTVSIDYATADNSAIAGQDYIATSGTLTFAPGETEKTISVEILSDSDFEMEEAFEVNLSNAVNAEILDGQGMGIIQNQLVNTLEPTLDGASIGNLDNTDDFYTHNGQNYYYDFYAVPYDSLMDSGDTVQVTVSSDDFDPMLMVLDGSGNVVEVNNNSSVSSTTAELTYEVGSEPFFVSVESMNADTFGEYQLDVEIM